MPRWQIGLHWRTDGEPLWTDDALLADPWPTEPQTTAPSTRDAGAAGARRRSPTGSDCPPSQVRPAYEDALSRLAAAVRLPGGRTGRGRRRPGRPTPPTRRAALLARLDEPVTEPAAYVLPLHRRDDDSGWASADWQLRRGRIVLLDGRLAGRAAAAAGLDQLGAAAADLRPRPADRSRTPCAVETEADAAEVEDADAAPTTALVAEVRDGLLYVFLPPTEELEHFVDLIARVEAAAAEVDCPVVIEGYGPPPDPRLGVDDDHPRPGRHRGQRRADGQLRRAAPAAGDPLRAGPAGPAGHRDVRRRRHATAAPAAATTSRSAASRPPIRRCCAGPTCWCRC